MQQDRALSSISAASRRRVRDGNASAAPQGLPAGVSGTAQLQPASRSSAHPAGAGDCGKELSHGPLYSPHSLPWAPLPATTGEEGQGPGDPGRVGGWARVKPRETPRTAQLREDRPGQPAAALPGASPCALTLGPDRETVAAPRVVFSWAPPRPLSVRHSPGPTRGEEHSWAAGAAGHPSRPVPSGLRPACEVGTPLPVGCGRQ